MWRLATMRMCPERMGYRFKMRTRVRPGGDEVFLVPIFGQDAAEDTTGSLTRDVADVIKSATESRGGPLLMIRSLISCRFEIGDFLARNGNNAACLRVLCLARGPAADAEGAKRGARSFRRAGATR